jgi:hypothetical protein
MSLTFAGKLIRFYKNLQPPEKLPKGIELLFPQQNPETLKIVKLFFKKYYSDDHPRRLIFGINPGRFGAGTTGINFTAPKQLKEYCGIDHSFRPQSELSAEFIYEMIERFGGPALFYREYFISAVSPLGYVRKGVNLNYYDDKKLQAAVTPFIVESIQQQISFGFKTDRCICVGGEKNYKFLSVLNEKNNWFQKIIPLPHPRFILQYRRKKKDEYIHQYLSALQLAG